MPTPLPDLYAIVTGLSSAQRQLNGVTSSSEPYKEMILGETGLRHYWPLDEESGDALDLVNPGAGYDGAVVDNDAYGGHTPGTGHCNRAASGPYDGIGIDFSQDGSQYDAGIQFDDSINGDELLETAFTWELWCKPSNVPTARTQYLLASSSLQGWPPKIQGFILKVQASTKTVTVTWGNGVTIGGLVQTGVYAGSATHIAIVHTGGTVKLYVDGALKDTDTWAYDQGDLSGTDVLSLAFGNWNRKGASFNAGGNGWIGHVAMYDIALDATDVLAHYNAGIA